MRPAMHRRTDSRGLNHLVFEVVDNSIDEFVAGHGTLIFGAHQRRRVDYVQRRQRGNRPVPCPAYGQ